MSCPFGCGTDTPEWVLPDSQGLLVMHTYRLLVAVTATVLPHASAVILP